MSNVLAIAQKELRSYFASPIAYVIIGLFALLFGYFFYAYLNFFVQRSQQMMRLAEPIMGDPGRVAKVVAGALSSRSPRPRYLVGQDAQLLALADQLTPTRVKDLVTRLSLGL